MSEQPLSKVVWIWIFLFGLLLGSGVTLLYYEGLQEEDEPSSQAVLPTTLEPTAEPTSLPELYSADEYYERGIEYWQERDWLNALTDLNRAIELDPTISDAYFIRAWTYNQIDTIWGFCQNAADLPPSCASFSQFKDLDALALADYTRAIELNPDHARAYNNRGMMYRFSKERDKAAADFERALEIDPTYGRAAHNLALTNYELGQYDDALRYERMANDLGVENLYFLAAVAMSTEDYEAAVEAFSTVIEANREYNMASWYERRAKAYVHLGQYAEAAADLTVAIVTYEDTMAPEDVADRYVQRAQAYAADGQDDKALADCSQAISLDSRQRDAYLLRADLEYKRGDKAAALADYQEYIRLHGPVDPDLAARIESLKTESSPS